MAFDPSRRRFDVVLCIPDGDEKGQIAVLCVVVDRHATVDGILEKLTKHSEAPEGLHFGRVRVMGCNHFLDAKAELADAIEESQKKLEAFADPQGAEGMTLSGPPGTRAVIEKSADAGQPETAVRPSDGTEVTMLTSLALEPLKTTGVGVKGLLKRIVGKTAKYVESVTFSFKSRTEEVILHGNKDDNAEFKRSVFILEDDELLLEAHQLDLKDDPAPPGTLGAELRLVTSRREIVISGMVMSKVENASKTQRRIVRAPPDRQLHSLNFNEGQLEGCRHTRSIYAGRRKHRDVEPSQRCVRPKTEPESMPRNGDVAVVS